MPQINCDISAYKLVSSERIVSCGGLTPLIQRIESMSDGQSYKHSLPEGIVQFTVFTLYIRTD